MLEGHAAALASQRLTDEQIAHLREVCAKTEKAIADKGDDARSVFQEFNRDFHSMIWAAADRPRMMGLLDTSLSLPFNTLGRYSENLTATMQRACWYHREIVAAFKARDEHRARTQMSAHVLSLISTDLP
jgi:DNA-binding GntR family transcriptional regulator